MTIESQKLIEEAKKLGVSPRTLRYKLAQLARAELDQVPLTEQQEFYKLMNERKYLHTLGDLIDRLSIVQLKEVFISEHKEEYSKEIADIVHDIQIILDETGGTITADTIRAIVVVSQMNLHIWHNESNYRRGIKDGNNLELTHGLNGIRNTAKNKIQEVVGGRKDYKVDCLAAEWKDWEISWSKQDNDNGVK
jgi:hypothetical protein